MAFILHFSLCLFNCEAAGPIKPIPSSDYTYGLIASNSTAAGTRSYLGITSTNGGSTTNLNLVGGSATNLTNYSGAASKVAGYDANKVLTNSAWNLTTLESAQVTTATTTTLGSLTPSQSASNVLVRADNSLWNFSASDTGAADGFARVAASGGGNWIRATNRFDGMMLPNLSRTMLHTNRFPGSALPSGWATNGGWTVSDKLISPTGGGGNATNVAYWDQHIAQNDVVWTATVVLRDATTSLALIRRDGTTVLSPGSQSSTICKFDFGAATLTLYNTWTDTTATALPTVKLSQAMGFTAVTNREYILSIGMSDPDHKFMSITDTITGSTSTLVSSTSGGGDMCDSPGFMYISGAFEVLDCALYSTRGPEVGVLVNTHSFGQASTLANARSNSWPRLLQAAMNGDVVIAAEGGEHSWTAVARTNTTENIFRATYEIIDLAANDGDLPAVWLPNMLKLAYAATNRGTIPIFATATPYAPNQTFLTMVNNYLLSTNTYGWLVVDFAKAVTTNGNRVDQIAAYFTIDAIHPNALGHAAMFAQLAKDQPQVFLGGRRRALAANYIAGNTASFTNVLITPPSSGAGLQIGRNSGQNSITGTGSGIGIGDSAGTFINQYENAVARINAPGGPTVIGAHQLNNADINLGGGIAYTTITTGGTKSLANSNVVYLVNSAGQTVTLPSAINRTGRVFIIGAVTPATSTTVATSLSELINGASSYTITGSNTFRHFVSDGANWWVTGGNETTLPVAGGGSGAATLTGALYGNGTGAFTASTGTSGRLSIWNASAPYFGSSLLGDNGTKISYNSATPRWAIGDGTDAFTRLDVEFPGLSTQGGGLGLGRYDNTTGHIDFIMFRPDATGGTVQNRLRSGTDSYLMNYAGNLGIGNNAPLAKLHVTGASTFTGSITNGALSPSLPVKTGANTNLVSGAINLASATEVTGTLAAANFPALTGDVTTSAGNLATTLATVATPGTSTKVTYNAKGLVTSGTAADLSGADVTGTLAAARMPALAGGNVTSSAGSVAANFSGALTGDLTVTSGNVKIATTGKGLHINTLANGKMGGATLASGTVTVANTSVTGNSFIFLSNANPTGTVGALYEDQAARIPGTSFVIKSSAGAADNSSVAYLIIEPLP